MLLTACATQPPSEAERAAFGDVAVRSVATLHAVEWDRPVTGWAAGLGMGAARGVGAIVVFPLAAAAAGGGSGQGFGELVAAAIGLATAAAWFPASVVGGAVTAPAPQVIDAAESVLRPILDDPGLGDAFGARCAEAVRKATGRDLADPTLATTVIEVRLVSISRGRTWNWWTFDRPFEVVVDATARVVRRSDGSVIWQDTAERGGVRADPPGEAVVRTYAEWAHDGGTELRAEIDAAMRELAHRFAHTIFVASPRDLLGRPVTESGTTGSDGDGPQSLPDTQ